MGFKISCQVGGRGKKFKITTGTGVIREKPQGGGVFIFASLI